VSGIVFPWDDAIFSMVRFECQEMRRYSLTLRNKIDRKKITLTEAVSKVEAFRVSIETKYSPWLSTAVPGPMQRMTTLIMKMIVSLLYVVLLHRYMNGVTSRIPNRLRQIVLDKGTTVLEAAIELESAKDLKPWAWYSASYQQYHVACLLLFEVFAYPMRKEGNRIWRCLDFIFAEPLSRISPPFTGQDLPSHQEIIANRSVKGRYLLTLIAERMRVYQEAKGLKSPVKLRDLDIAVMPQQVGEDLDPKMPLNYAHDQWSYESGSQFTKEARISSLQSPFDEAGSGGDDEFSHHSKQTSQNMTGAGVSCSGGTPAWLPYDERNLENITKTTFRADHFDNHFMDLPEPPSNGPFTGSNVGSNGVIESIDPKMLDIDWASSLASSALPYCSDICDVHTLTTW
jgi:hypothetical protein